MMKNKNTQSGFTLVEISIVLLIMGMITGAVFAFVTPMQDLKYRQTTQEKQKKVVQALANFAQQYGRLPCPADPNPTPASDLGVELAACGTDTLRNGVVPFRTLGLAENDILDGWKRPFTYIVDEKAKDAPPSAAVHAQCRNTGSTPPWVAAGVNNNPNKASFCCQQNAAGSRLEIFNDPAKNPGDLVVLNLQSGGGGFAGVNTGSGTSAADLGYLAFALVSHGKNGSRAYSLRVTGRPPALYASVESENYDDDADVLDLPINLTSGSDYFDDIVVWRTQQGLIAEFGNDSCNVP